MPKKVIYKYSVGDGNEQLPPQMPTGAKLVAVEVIDRDPYVWAVVDPDAPLVGRQMFYVATGQPFESTADGCTPDYVGTFLIPDVLESGPFVGHVLDYGEESL